MNIFQIHSYAVFGWLSIPNLLNPQHDLWDGSSRLILANKIHVNLMVENNVQSNPSSTQTVSHLHTAGSAIGVTFQVESDDTSRGIAGVYRSHFISNGRF